MREAAVKLGWQKWEAKHRKACDGDDKKVDKSVERQKRKEG